MKNWLDFGTFPVLDSIRSASHIVCLKPTTPATLAPPAILNFVYACVSEMPPLQVSLPRSNALPAGCIHPPPEHSAVLGTLGAVGPS